MRIKEAARTSFIGRQTAFHHSPSVRPADLDLVWIVGDRWAAQLVRIIDLGYQVRLNPNFDEVPADEQIMIVNWDTDGWEACLKDTGVGWPVEEEDAD